MARTSKKGGFTMRGWTAGQGTGSHSAFTKPTDVSSKAVRERAYEEEHGESYQDSAEGTELGHTAMTELQKQPETKQNIFRQIFSPGKSTIKVESEEDQEKREQYDEEGNPISNVFGRTKTYTDEKGNKIMFKNEKERQEYLAEKEKIEERKFNVYGDSATITESGDVVETPKTDEYTDTTIGGEHRGYLNDKGEYVPPEEAQEIREAHDIKLEKERIAALEAKNERKVKDAEKTGVTGDVDFSFEGELDEKYKDRDRKLVLDEKTGEITEKVKRKGPAGWLGIHKKTGRVHTDENWAAEADAQKKIDEEKKNKKKNKKKNNKKRDNKKDDSVDTNKKKKKDKDKDKDKDKKKRTNTPVDPGAGYNYGP